MAAIGGERVADRLAAAAAAGPDLVAFWREAEDAITPHVPHHMGLCWFTLDPASLLITSHFNVAIDEIPAEMLAMEHYGDDVHDVTGVARSREGISTLHEAAGGDPTGSPRWQANMQLGGDQELIAALRTPRGEVWGALSVHRAPGAPVFTAAEVAFVRALTPVLAEGARRALLVGGARDPDAPDAPGLIVLGPDWDLESATPGAERWIDELPGGDWAAGRLPPAVLAVGGQALRRAEDRDDPRDLALTRVRTRSGGWAMLHGMTLVTGGERRVAVIAEPAHPGRIAPLLMSAYGLTEREQEITRLVLQGDSTREIAARLVVSEHTVQQHMKAIFGKTGVRSRRDLVGKVFEAHYAPRVRDNASRAADGRPLRGGPVPRGPAPPA
ncbi:MAG TPA: LuxR C-terminal-related transcriptional regulator [Miltoncostaeaceae bacterium]|nr:LuxR C-terminal-related transcriptional regulator [Miltoncostaeaceae bacterium]